MKISYIKWIFARMLLVAMQYQDNEYVRLLEKKYIEQHTIFLH